MSGERQLPVVPRAQGVEQDIVLQAPAQFDTLVNVDLSRGMIEARKGWRMCRSVDTWGTQVDSGAVTRYIPSTYKSITSPAWPLGAFVYSAPDGCDYVLEMRHSGATSLVYFRAYSTTGHLLNNVSGASIGQLLNVGGVYDAPDKPYTFAVAGQEVYFCNGGTLWRWSHRNYYAEAVQAYAEPIYAEQRIYFQEMRFASILCEHNSSMVYAGFNERYLATDPIDTNQDGIITTADAGKDGFVIGDGRRALLMTPYTLAVSDTGAPRCISMAGVSLLLGRAPISGLASFNRRLVVFSQSEMFVIDGAVSLGQGAVQRVSSGVGCVAHRTICQAREGLLLWLAVDGVYAWDGSGRPEKVSSAVDPMFGVGQTTATPAQFGASFTAKNLQLPYIAKRQLLPLASAAIHQDDGYYALALSAGSSAEVNNVTLCVDYRDGRCWFQVGRPTATGTVATASLATGIYTMLASHNQTKSLLCQGYFLEVPELSVDFQDPITSICVQDGITDQTNSISDLAPGNTSFDMFALSSRLFYGDSSQKLPRQLHFRMQATRRHDFRTEFVGGAADTNKIKLAYLPEFAGFDQADQTTAVFLEYATEVEPWPDQYRANTYFWQDTTNNSALIGRWDNGTTAADKVWAGTMYFDKRVDLKGEATQFFRFALWKVVDRDSGPSLRLLSVGVAAKAGAGQR